MVYHVLCKFEKEGGYMAISFYKIKKWYKMLVGKSIYHVEQGIGKRYSIDKVEGYYNDLTQKVLLRNEDELVPLSYVDTGEAIFFSIGIFQFGLGAYDLYLINKNDAYRKKVLACADWAVNNQEVNGGWETFSYENSEHPYSSMAQGEGISLLVRAYGLTNEEKYKNAADKAKDFMLRPVEKGGTTVYKSGNIYFYECTYDPLILNGWIFSLWGVFDYMKAFPDDSIKEIYDKSVQTIARMLPKFDIGYWSKYELGKRISSPFYHKLHISQLQVMYKLTGEKNFIEYANKFSSYYKNWFYRKIAFVIKARQKIFE